MSTIINETTVNKAFDLGDTAISEAAVGVRKDHPDWTEEEVTHKATAEAVVALVETANVIAQAIMYTSYSGGASAAAEDYAGPLKAQPEPTEEDFDFVSALDAIFGAGTALAGLNGDTPTK